MPDILPAIGSQLIDTGIFNGVVPKEGPKGVAIPVPFDNVRKTFVIQTLLAQSQKFISQIVGVYVDNSANPNPLIITTEVINETIEFPARSQGYLPLLAPKNANITLTSLGATPISIVLLNVPVPAVVWSADGSQGAMTGMAGNSGVTGAAALIVPANPLRSALIVSNTGTVPFVLAGSSADAAAGNGVTVPAGQSFSTSPPAPYVGPLYAFSASAGAYSYSEFTA